MVSKGAALQIAHCQTSASILGYNRTRDLAWDTVTSHKTEEEQECLHVWTTRGDCAMLPSTKLSTTHGVITAAKLANLVRDGEEVRIEVPRVRPVRGLVGARTNGGAATLLRLRLLPFRCGGKAIVRVHTLSLQPLTDLLTELGLKPKKRARGRFWSWIVLRDDPTSNETGNYRISLVNLELVNILTRIAQDKNTEWRTTREESLFRVFLQLKFLLSDEPFEVSVAPKINPMEITLSPSDAWQPYARTLAVTRSKSSLVRLEFATPSFTPIVNNFMLLY